MSGTATHLGRSPSPFIINQKSRAPRLLRSTMKKSRLVKAGSKAAEHNLEQAQRIQDVAQTNGHKGHNGNGNGHHRSRKFNPLLQVTNEDRLAEMKAEFKELEDKMSCESCPPELVKAYNKQALELLQRILSLQQYMAKKVPVRVREKAMELMGLTNMPKGKTKAKAKIPKQGNHGLRRGSPPYDGLHKQSSKAPPVPGKPSIAYVGPSKEPGPDKTAFNKPQKPTTPKQRPGYLGEHHDAKKYGYTKEPWGKHGKE